MYMTDAVLAFPVAEEGGGVLFQRYGDAVTRGSHVEERCIRHDDTYIGSKLVGSFECEVDVMRARLIKCPCNRGFEIR